MGSGAARHGAQGSPLLSVPNLLDIAILYGGDNQTLTGQIIAKVHRPKCFLGVRSPLLVSCLLAFSSYTCQKN